MTKWGCLFVDKALMRYSRPTSSFLKAFSHFILHHFVISLTCVCSLIWMPTQDSPCEVLTTVAIVSQHRCESNSKVYWIGTCLSSMHIHIKTDVSVFMWPLKILGPHEHQICDGNMWKYGTELLKTNYPFRSTGSGHLDGAILLATRWSS